MIKFLQSGNRAAKYILAGFLLILAASMVTYLIPGFMSGSEVTQDGIVASVGGHEVRTAEVAMLVSRVSRQRGWGPEAARFLTPTALQNLIQQAEIAYEADRLGLQVSDRELRDELQNGPYRAYLFQDNKWIGADGYRRFAEAQNMSVEEFERTMRSSMLAQKLLDIVTAKAVVPDSAVEQAYKETNTKAKFQYALIQLDDILKTIKPAETELKAYFDANQVRYQNAIPEKRAIKYFVVNDKDVSAKINVDDAEIQRYYSAHQDEFRTPERVKVRHILIATPQPGPDGKVDQKAVDDARAKALDVLKQVKAGGDFAALAKKYSADPGSKDNGGEMGAGWITRGQTVPEFEKVAFGQNKGQISDPVQSSFGFHIIQTEDKESAQLTLVAKAKPEIESKVKQEKLTARLNKISSEAVDAAQKLGLDKAAGQYDTQVVSSNPVARTDSLPGVGAQPAFMDQVFITPEKSPPQIARIPTGYVVFQIAGIVPARKPSFEEIKDRVTREFKNERANDVLRRKAEELADRAHVEHDLAKAAKEAGATLKTSNLVGRNDQAPEIGSMAGPASVAFNLKPGEISNALNFGKAQGALQVLERQEPSPADPQFAKERDRLRDQLMREKQQEIQTLFLNDLGARLEKEGKIKINKTEINNLNKARS